tara:strand:- start:217 stop:450 length:234 start_codon:yes stop_codon:yes gene_type:complete
MPSISGIENKITDIIDHVFLLNDMGIKGPASELRDNIIRFVNDRETREQAERRIIEDVLSDINHRNCGPCDNLRSAL